MASSTRGSIAASSPIGPLDARGGPLRDYGADPVAIRASVEPGSHDFDEAFSAAVHEDVLVVGWAHDTLTSIKENAAQLLRQIDARLGASEAPIALVCHSRGGLLARKLAVLAPERIPAASHRVRHLWHAP